MATPTALLKFTAKAVLHVAGPNPDVEAAVNTTLAAEVIWIWWSQGRDPAARWAELVALGQAAPDDVRRAVAQAVQDVAGDQSIDFRQALALYLMQMLAAVRRTLPLAATPTGRVLPQTQALQHAADLLPLLPDRLPRPVSGDRSLAGVTVTEPKPRPPAAEPLPAAEKPAAPPGDGSSPIRITLTVTAGPHQGRTFTFAGHETFLVGRSKRAHFQLPIKDKYFSRIHFMVEVNPPHCRLMDMGSRNGTFVNGQRVSTADLNDGDKIEAGRTVLRLAVEGAGPSPATSQGMPPTVTVGGPTPVPQPVVRPPAATPAPTPFPTPPRPIVAVTTCRVCGTAMPKAGAALPVCPLCQEESQKQPQPVAGYQVIREVGRGGMGIVYQALRQADASVVALKTTIPAVAGTPSQVERFLREARILEQLQHPNIVAFREMGESNGQLYFAMDFVQGTDLGKLLKKDGPLAVGRAVGLICQLLEALEYAHAHGFVHRDIKPANLMVTRGAGGEVLQLADFGLARAYQASQLSGLTMMGEMGGTVAFMAPEQITHYREAKPPVDQYSAAASLYNLVTGYFIYDMDRNIQRQLLMILQDDPVPIRQRRSDVPAGLAEVIHKALQREPGERFADVKAMRKALGKFGA